MMKITLQYVHEYCDRHGKVRRYFRRRGKPGIRLPGQPGSTEFMEVYNAALASLTVSEIGKNRSIAGTVGATIGAYYTDHKFLAMAVGTQKARRRILERFRKEHGDKRLAMIQRPNIAKLLSPLPPFAARNWLMTLRGLMQFSVAIGLRPDDPTAGIEQAKAREGSIHTWTEFEIAQFEAHHPVGSRARLAMALLLYTGQRRSDVVRMGPQHIRDSVLTVRQKKTGTPLMIPIHPELAAIIAASPIGHLAFLISNNGGPYQEDGFGNIFRSWCRDAGMSAGCSAHGLRKAACRRLAEAGCSAPQIAAISGHKNLKEVQRYIADADQVGLAQAAIRAVSEHAANVIDANPVRPRG